MYILVQEFECRPAHLTSLGEAGGVTAASCQLPDQANYSWVRYNHTVIPGTRVIIQLFLGHLYSSSYS
jgi:hypothetical protein